MLAELAEASPFCYNAGMESPVCAGCRERDRLLADLRRRTSQLEAQVERLTRLLEKARRDGKRQAAPLRQRAAEARAEAARSQARPGLRPQGSSSAPRPHR